MDKELDMTLLFLKNPYSKAGRVMGVHPSLLTSSLWATLAGRHEEEMSSPTQGDQGPERDTVSAPALGDMSAEGENAWYLVDNAVVRLNGRLSHKTC